MRDQERTTRLYWERKGRAHPIYFERLPDPDKAFMTYNGLCFYRVLSWGHPEKGDYYLSGNPVSAWLAPNDLSHPYWIVEPMYKAKQVTSYVRGDRLTRE